MSHPLALDSRDFYAPLDAETHKRMIIARARRIGDAYRATKPPRMPHAMREAFGDTLKKYAGMIRGKAHEFARRTRGRTGAYTPEDFKQAGELGAWEAFARDGALNPPLYRSMLPPAYFRKAITNEMINELRWRERPNYDVWRYDRNHFPSRVHRYRYGGKEKAHIQYHERGLEVLDTYFAPPLSVDEEDEDGRARWELAEDPDGLARGDMANARIGQATTVKLVARPGKGE